jgi:hypothetical protein
MTDALQFLRQETKGAALLPDSWHDVVEIFDLANCVYRYYHEQLLITAARNLQRRYAYSCASNCANWSQQILLHCPGSGPGNSTTGAQRNPL